MPTIILSELALKGLLPKKQNTSATIGIYKLDPDYPKYMNYTGKNKQFPSDDYNLNPYRTWNAGKDHFDFQNNPEMQI